MALAKLFNFCNPLALENAQTRRAWAGYGVVGVPAREAEPASTIRAVHRALCDVLLAANSTSVDALATLSARQRGGRCVDASLSQNFEDGSDALSWPWQTRRRVRVLSHVRGRESQCPFARGYVSVADGISICSQFGLTPSVVADSVAFSNAVYGGARPQGSRILFPNGWMADPWTGLGVLESPRADGAGDVGPRRVTTHRDAPGGILLRSEVVRDAGRRRSMQVGAGWRWSSAFVYTRA